MSRTWEFGGDYSDKLQSLQFVPMTYLRLSQCNRWWNAMSMLTIAVTHKMTHNVTQLFPEKKQSTKKIPEQYEKKWKIKIISLLKLHCQWKSFGEIGFLMNTSVSHLRLAKRTNLRKNESFLCLPFYDGFMLLVCSLKLYVAVDALVPYETQSKHQRHLNLNLNHQQYEQREYFLYLFYRCYSCTLISSKVLS